MKCQYQLSLFILCIMTCFANFLAESSMKPYTGQTWSDCRFFVHLYEYDASHYFIMDNYCLDLIATPLDCDGEPLCDTEDFVNCDIFEGSVYIGVAGVGEL
jgi:hypothetical protein